MVNAATPPAMRARAWTEQASHLTALDAWEHLHWSVIPLDDDKRPCKTGGTHPDGNPKRLGWKSNQAQHATKGDILNWQRKYKPAAFAVISGAISGLAILDFDGETGRATMERLGLAPHVRTGSGGYHVYFEHPGWPVKTLNSKSKIELGRRWPGLDIRADGGYAAFCGKNTSGPYAWLREPEPDALSLLPDDLRAFLGLLTPPDEAGDRRPSADILIDRALASIGQMGRNDGGMWLACQLRDNGYSQPEAESMLLTYAARTPTTNTKGQHEPYTDEEALASVRSAFTRPAREAWKSSAQAARPIGPISHALNGNGANGNATSASLPALQPPGYNLTDYGNAERLVARHGRDMRYCYEMGRWLVWSRERWKEDKGAQVEQKAKATVRAIYAEAAETADDARRKALGAHAIRSESKKLIAAMLDLARSEQGIPITRDELDTNPWLLNCSNGTVNLRTGDLQIHRREDYITRCIATRFNPNAPRHLWEATLQKIFNGDTELIAFFKRALGYALTGDTSEQCFFLLFGSGSNGKSTLLEVIQAILGEYAQAAEFKAFLSRDNEGIRNDIARMNGKRLVVAKEADKGKQLAEALVKTLTGGDTITARFLHQEYFDFKPQFKLFLAANHKPEIKGTDLGIWRRVRLIPFEITIPDKDKDKNLSKKLLEEAEGILAWLVEGCLEWQREGLGEPQIVLDATKVYRDEMDRAAQFLKDNCRLQEPAPGQGNKGNFSTSTTDLMQCFTAWCEGEKADTKLLKTKLNEMGYYSKRGTGGRFYWQGVELIEPQDSDDLPSTREGTPQNSEGSEGSEVKKGISLTKAQNSEKIPDSTSLPSLPSLSQEDEAALAKLAEVLNSGKLRDKQQVFSTLPEPNYGHLRKERYLVAIRAGLLSDDARARNAARDELEKRLEGSR